MPELSIDPTQWVGIAAFTIAAIACSVAARGRPIAWRWIAVVQLACGAEVAFGTRYMLHDAVDFALQAEGRYDARHPVQWALALAMLLVVAGCVTTVAWRAHRLGAGLGGGLIGTLFAVATFGMETVSLHEIDALMYAMAGPIKTIGWLWICIAGITTASARRSAREPGRKR